MGIPTLKQKYLEQVIPQLSKELGRQNRMSLPRLEKVVVNMGIGNVDGDTLKAQVGELAMITGQRPQITKARKSISNFKLRKGNMIGAKVTLRGGRMYEFLDRLLNAALPRIRDFRGLSPGSFDGRGNYTFGIKEQTIFPEIAPDRVTAVQGMDVTLRVRNAGDGESYKMLKALGVPFADLGGKTAGAAGPGGSGAKGKANVGESAQSGAAGKV